MVTLFDQEKVMEFHDYNLAKEQRAEEKEVNIRAMIRTLQMLSTSREDAVHLLVANWELSPQEAEEKVAQYWDTRSKS